jgi:phage-related baseplate assembly protein
MADLDELLLPATRAVWDDFQMTVAIDIGLPTTSWRPETPERVVIDANARSLEILSVPTAYEAIRGGFLGYARGAWLTLHAAENFDTDRNLATAAAAPGVFNNTSNVPYSIPTGDSITVKKSGTDVTYRVPGPFTIPANGIVDAGIVATAETVGPEGNAGIGAINEVVDALPGVTFTNTAAAVGSPEESDEALAARAQLAASATSPAGPSDAYRYVATTPNEEFYPDPADRALVDVTRVAVIEDENTGDVRAYYANSAGGVSNATRDVVNDALLEWVVPIGVDFTGFAADNLNYTITYTAYISAQDNLTEAEVLDAVEAALSAFFPTIPIQGYPVPGVNPPGIFGIMPLDIVRKVILNTTINGIQPIFKVTMGFPPGDLTILEGQVLVLVAVNGTVIIEDS